MLQDLRYAARLLLKNKGWTATVVGLLALGIGANTALFSAINGMLLQKLEVANPDTLVSLKYVGPNQMYTDRTEYGNFGRDADLGFRTTFSYPHYQELRKANRTLTDMSASAPLDSVSSVVDNQAEIASAFVVSGNFHGLLGIQARLGRTIASEDDQPGATPVAVISHGYWRRRFAENPNALGKVVQINNIPVVIVGVLAREFAGVQRTLGEAPDFTFPLAFYSQLTGRQWLGQATVWWLQIMGRLRPNTTMEQVAGNLDGVFRQATRQGMDSYLASLPPEEQKLSGNQNRTDVPQLRVSSAARGFYGFSQQDLRTITLLSIVVGLLLLMVCANVANLMLSHASGRMREVSVRLSIGATRARLVRQLLTESMLVSFIGGGLGLIVAAWGKELIPGSARHAPLDATVLLFMFGLTFVTGIVFGIAPALRTAASNVNVALKESSRNLSGSRTALAKSLVVLQVAVSLVLLTGAGLFLRTVQNLRSVEVGFNPQNLALFRVDTRLNRYDRAQAMVLQTAIIERLKTLPGIKATSYSSAALLSGSEADTNMVVQGREQTATPQDVIYQLTVSHDFFSTMEIPIAAGRSFAATDTETSPGVAVINKTAAKRFFPNENPIGQRFGTTRETSGRFEIVGIARDARYNSLRDLAPPTAYFLFPQRPVPAVTFEVRTLDDPSNLMPSIREAVREIDPKLPLLNISTQTQQIARRFEQESTFARAYSLFGTAALLLVCIGLFGLMSYSVTRRTYEIGIRLALGANRLDVLRMVMRESLFLVGIGLAIGLAASLAAGRFIATLLFDLAPTDALSIVAAMGVLTVVSALAGYIPARRASRVNPIVALHYE
jgi:predicted permease